MRKETGFTLIELMVTIALLALFAVIALPAMNGMIERQRVTSTLSNYTNALTYARNEAIRQNIPVEVCGAQISSAGQLSKCSGVNDWSEGIFLFGKVNKEIGYRTDVTPADINIRVVKSPNESGGISRVIINSSARKSTGGAIASLPHFQFLPNGQVARLDTSNKLVVADMYLRLEVVSVNDDQKKAVALMDPTGQIIHCTKKVIDSNSGNNIAAYCTS